MTGAVAVKAWSDPPIDFMSAPLVQWLAGLTGWDPFVSAVAIGVFLIFCYMALFMSMFSFVRFLIAKGKNSTGIVSLAWYLLALSCGLVVLILDVFHTIVFVIVAVAFISSLISGIMK